MNSDTVKITDKKEINEIIMTRFESGRIFVKTSDINIQVESYSFENGLISITLPGDSGVSGNVIFYIRDKDEVTFSNAVLQNENENGTLSFDLLDVQILNIPRKESRKSIASVDAPEASSIYISNIISDFLMHERFDFLRRKVEMIKDKLLSKLQNIYPESEIIFSNEKSKDPRMIFFVKERRPYFIEKINDVNDSRMVRGNEDLQYYKSFIFQTDPEHENPENVSEICVPLLYKSMMPFGYVKCESPVQLNEEDFSAIEKFGMFASGVYTNDKQIIISSDDRIAVTDLSKSGLGIFFKNKVLIKHFKENSLIVFSIFLPGDKQATFLCEVRNISLIKNFVYRIGCEILNIESRGEVFYKEYLEGLDL